MVKYENDKGVDWDAVSQELNSKFGTDRKGKNMGVLVLGQNTGSSWIWCIHQLNYINYLMQIPVSAL